MHLFSIHMHREGEGITEDKADSVPLAALRRGPHSEADN